MRRVGGAVAGLPLVLALAACGGSAQHVGDICGDVTRGTAALARYDPARPVTALTFALDRFELVEAAVGKAREAGLPDDAAAVLRADWLEPAVRSMASWDTRLETLRTAVHGGGRRAIDTAFAAALRLGTDGVDTGALARAGYDACAAAFTAPTPAAASA